MKNYFKLYPFCQLLDGINGGCVYDVFTEREKFQVGCRPELQERIPPSLSIQRAYFVLSSKCDLGCKFCNSKMNRKTGCKYHSQQEALEDKDWVNISQQLKDLGCTTFNFIGGDPLLCYGKLKSIIEAIKNTGISDIKITTNGTLLNDEIATFLYRNCIEIVLQVTTQSESIILDTIKRLTKSNIRYSVTILISKYNEDSIERIVTQISQFTKKITLDFLYYLPNNSHYSSKYVEMMKDKVFLFPSVSSANFSMLSRYNNCLYGQVAVMPNGDVTPCPMMDSKVLGNIKSNSIYNILASGEYNKVITMPKERISNCKLCSYRKNCDNCRAIEANVHHQIRHVLLRNRR